MFLTQSQIVSEINAFGLYSIGVGREPDPAKLKDLSLQDMLDAVRQIERDNEAARAKGIATNTSFDIQIVPDDRLTAAVYSLLHYSLPPYRNVADDDDAIVHLKIGGVRYGLIAWAREEN